MSLSDETFKHEKVLRVSIFPPKLVGIVKGGGYRLFVRCMVPNGDE